MHPESCLERLWTPQIDEITVHIARIYEIPAHFAKIDEITRLWTPQIDEITVHIARNF